nr:hypothetical protein [Candidatus Levybacteria bacterium]
MDMPIMPTGEELLEQGKTTAANVVKSTASDIANSVSGQIGLKTEPTVQAQQSQSQFQNQPQDQAQQGEPAQLQTERTKEMIKDFYSPSDGLVQGNPQTAVAQEQQLAQVRHKLQQELHNEVYYNPLFAYEHDANKTESKVEELEREEKQEMMELQQKEADKPPPLAVQRAQTHTETNPGIAG